MSDSVQPFTPEQQAKVDEIVKDRIAREKEKWEKESDATALRQQLEAKEDELRRIQGTHALDMELHRRGLENGGKAERIKRLLDLESAETPVSEQIEALEKEVPELFRPMRGAGSRGSGQPVLRRSQDDEAREPLTREQLEKMSPEEINQPGTWERVQKFLAGQR
jgi:hypothetical protein